MRKRPAPPRTPDAGASPLPAVAPAAALSAGIRYPALAALLLVAAALRLWHLREGLPDFTQEAYPFRHAFEMAGWGSGRIEWDPHAFHYPSLAFYLHMGLQWLHYAAGRLAGTYALPADYFVAFQVDPTPMVMVARTFGVACDLAVIAAVFAIGERAVRGAGMLAAAVVTLSPTFILETRLSGVDAPFVALTVWALERMLAYRATGNRRTLVASGVLIGLATGTKYPAAALLLPLAWVMWERHGRGGIVRWAGAALGAGAVFLATSPFLLVEGVRLRSDALKLGDMLSAGQLGSLGGGGPAFYLGRLANDPGWIVLALAAVSLVLVPRARREGPPWRALWLYTLAFAVPVFLTHTAFVRYLLPVLPALALLAAFAGVTLLATKAGQAPRATRLVSDVLTVVFSLSLPLLTGPHAAASGEDSTQSQARRWLEGHVPDATLIVQEEYAAPLLSDPERARILDSRTFAQAGTAWRERYLARRTMHAVTLPFVAGGRGAVAMPVAGGGTRYLDVWRNGSDLNQVFYEPALYTAVDAVVTSDAVRGRYLADPDRYPAQVAFYRLLDSTAVQMADFRSSARVSGPEIRVYRLGAAWRAASRARGDSLDELWWANSVPLASRRALSGPDTTDGGAGVALRDDSGRPAPWVHELGAMFDQVVSPFAYEMAAHVAELGRVREARAFARALLASGTTGGKFTQSARALLASLPPEGARNSAQASAHDSPAPGASSDPAER